MARGLRIQCLARVPGAGMTRTHFHVVIVGGGTGGIVVAQLLRRSGLGSLAIIEPSRTHYYQPLWTLVGAGAARQEASARPEARFIPQGATWIQDQIREALPRQSLLKLLSGDLVGYDFLVLAPGAEYDWDAIPGLVEALRFDNATTNYVFDLAPRTWRLIQACQSGVALFHMPASPIKCPGAPQKIMYLAADYFRRRGRARDVRVVYASGPPAIFGAPEYAAPLNRVLERYQVDARFSLDLVEIRPERREAIFRARASDERTTIPYSFLHVVPPHRAPRFLRESEMADPATPAGWAKVDRATLWSPDFANVFALGDAAGTPNAKTGAAALHQAPVVAANLLAVARGQEPVAAYDGYIACPITTGYGRLVLAELDYSGRPAPSLPGLNTFRERRDLWFLKKYGLPWLYWHAFLRGWTPARRSRSGADLPRTLSSGAPAAPAMTPRR